MSVFQEKDIFDFPTIFCGGALSLTLWNVWSSVWSIVSTDSRNLYLWTFKYFWQSYQVNYFAAETRKGTRYLLRTHGKNVGRLEMRWECSNLLGVWGFFCRFQNWSFSWMSKIYDPKHDVNTSIIVNVIIYYFWFYVKAALIELWKSVNTFGFT